MAEKTKAAPANEERGEIAITLDGVRMGLRPSYEAIAAFEAGTGKGLLDLARASLGGSLTLAETAMVACECIRSWGRATENASAKGANADRIAELIMETDGGLATVMGTLGGLLSLAATGGVTAQGEVKATTTSQTTG